MQPDIIDVYYSLNNACFQGSSKEKKVIRATDKGDKTIKLGMQLYIDKV